MALKCVSAFNVARTSSNEVRQAASTSRNTIRCYATRPLKFRRYEKAPPTLPLYHRRFMERLAPKLNVKIISDWHNITCQDLEDKGATWLTKRQYDRSLFKALQIIYPEYEWHITEFKNLPKYVWEEVDNQRTRFEAIGEQLGLCTFDSWYDIAYKDVTWVGGLTGIIKKNITLFEALTKVYPYVNWDIKKFKFKRRPELRKFKNRQWKNMPDVKKFIKELEVSMHIKRPSDWQRVSNQQLRLQGAAGLVVYWPYILGQFYPSENWDWSKFKIRNKKTRQVWLIRCVKWVLSPSKTTELSFEGST